ncbi:MAG: hypothetical protein WC886_07945 [Saccharofermentanaceae bacterium]
MAQGYQTQQPQRQPQKEVTTAERAKSFIDRIAPKMDLTKGQKDSLTTIFTQFIDDVEKYRAENNGKVIIYMQKIRDDKVKALLRNETKYNKYLDIMDDIKNQRNPQQNPEQQRPSGPPPNGGSGSRGPS